jgi:hypothetical protein
MLAAIRKWVIQTMMKGQTGVVQTMPKQQIIEMNTQITAERIMRNGINPEDLKTVGQVENVVNQIDAPKVNVNPGITGVKKAEVFDIDGNKIPEGSKILGGKEVPTSIDQESFLQRVKKAVDENRDYQNKKKAIDELQNYTKSKEEIVQDLVDRKFGKGYFDTADESEAAIKARLDAGNKKGIAGIKNNKMIDDAIEDASPGFADGDTKYDAELVAENLAERRGLTYDDLSPKERSKIYGEAYDALAEQRFRGRRKPKGDDPEEKADGGRIGFFKGAQADASAGKGAMSPGTDTKGNVRDDNPFTGGGGNNPPPKTKTKTKTTTTPPPQKTPVVTNPIKNLSKHFANNQKLKNAVAAGLITNEEYNTLGGYDAKQTLGMGPIDTGLASLGYNVVQSALGPKFNPNPQPFSEIFGDVARNVKGATNISPELQDKYENIMQMADGGRIGLKAGMTKRAFLKLMGSVGAGIGAAKSGIFSLGKGAGKEVAKEVVQQTTTATPPPYFFKLAEKIKMMGADSTATTERVIAKSLKSKDGKSEYLLEEDMVTGDTIIKKINKEGDEMITDVEIMELKKGEVVMGKDGKPIKVPDEYEEVTEANARIEGDVFNDPYYSDGIQVDEIIKEVDDKVPSIKYASGGLAYMLGE